VKNGVDTAASVAISGSGTTATWTGEVEFAQYDVVTVKGVPASDPAPTHVQWIADWQPETANYQWMPGGSGATNIADGFFITLGVGSSMGSSTADAKIRVPIAGTYRNLTVVLENAPGVGKNYTFTVGSDLSGTKPTVTISGANKTGTSTGTFSFSNGASYIWIAVTGNSTVSSRAWVSMDFTPTTSGLSFYPSVGYPQLVKTYNSWVPVSMDKVAADTTGSGVHGYRTMFPAGTVKSWVVDYDAGCNYWALAGDVGGDIYAMPDTTGDHSIAEGEMLQAVFVPATIYDYTVRFSIVFDRT